MSNKRLQTTLDRLPYGEELTSTDLKVRNILPEGVKSTELYRDIIRIAWPSFVELLLTQLASMVDLMIILYHKMLKNVSFLFFSTLS